MPSTPSPGSRSGAAARIRFRRAVTLMLMTLVVPGSAQIAVGSKRTGRIALRIWLSTIGLVVMVALLALVARGFVFWLLSNTVVLAMVRFALMGMAIGMVLLFVDAWRLGDPLGLRQRQRQVMVGLNAALCFSVAGALLFAAHVVNVQRDFIGAMFASTTTSEAHDGRYNVLLLGGDSGQTRWGMRPDSITVASIDADTGRTVLFGLPRNLQNFPFADGSVMDEQFPNGYDCDGCEINSLVTWAQDHRDLFGDAEYPGVEATKMAVEGVTGLKVNYFAMVNLNGFRSLVDAVGGVKLHVRDRIPKGAIDDFDGKSYIEPGYRTLDGEDTLWFARSRMAADDYSRMARQKCVMAAMLAQLNPRTVVLRFGEIAKASKRMVRTDIPAGDLGTFVDLALQARRQPIRTVSFVPPMISTYEPDVDVVQDAVEKAIDRSEGTDAPAKRKKARPSGTTKPTTTGGSIGSMKQGYAANESDDLQSAC